MSRVAFIVQIGLSKVTKVRYANWLRRPQLSQTSRGSCACYTKQLQTLGVTCIVHIAMIKQLRMLKSVCIAAVLFLFLIENTPFCVGAPLL